MRFCMGKSPTVTTAGFITYYSLTCKPGGTAKKKQKKVECIQLFPWWLMVKNPPASVGNMSSIPGSGRFPGGGNGNHLKYSCLENLTDRGASQATVLQSVDMTQ